MRCCHRVSSLTRLPETWQVFQKVPPNPVARHSAPRKGERLELGQQPPGTPHSRQVLPPAFEAQESVPAALVL